MKFFYQLIALLIILCSTSCTSYQALLNYQEQSILRTKPQTILNYKPLTIQANDLLRIGVSSIDVEAIRPFSMSNGEGEKFGEYLVSSEGFIDFPTIGKIELKGLQLEEAKLRILEQLSPYFKQNPIVQLRLVSFRVNVNGEVSNPGSFPVQNNRLTIIEALTLAGDFTNYSRRDSILIIREEDGIRNFGYVNFYSSELFNSPYFYLQQNDVVYVQPDKTKVNLVRDPASRFLPWVTTGISLVLLILAVNRN